MKKFKILLTTLICMMLFSQSSYAGSERLILTGSSTVAPLALEIGKRFEQLHAGVRVDVQTGGSTRGVLDARSGTADIGMASRALKGTEQDLTSHLIGMDGISIILHRNNPVKMLSNAQIIAIFTGKIRNWQQVGGENRSITVVNKAEGHSTLELFLHHFSLKNSQIKADVIIGDNQQGIKTVAGNPNAIGYVSIGTAEYEEAQGTAIKRLPMAGIAPTTEQVRLGKFPLSRPLNLITKGKPSSLAQSFIDFARSPAVRDLVEAQFFVAVASQH
ncbi:MAG: phosphate ABC transporter substrate-binding protein [Mariprofundaceae bacterium]|nr:phosphate ABC transporter substrate-binding protein [Mariprofundaceae bacterium]